MHVTSEVHTCTAEPAQKNDSHIDISVPHHSVFSRVVQRDFPVHLAIAALSVHTRVTTYALS